MKIILIRHGKVDMDWKGSYDSKGFDEACAEYDKAPLLPYDGREVLADGYDIYISELPRTRMTADQMINVRDYIETPLLNEVPKRSFRDFGGKLPRFMWVALSRIQWFFNSSRQWETKRDTKKRAAEMADLLEKNNRDAVLFTHEFYLYTLKGELEKRGFLIERSDILRIKNWERIRATKRNMHCGVCSHNCLLTNPGCDVGRDAAKRQLAQ